MKRPFRRGDSVVINPQVARRLDVNPLDLDDAVVYQDQWDNATVVHVEIGNWICPIHQRNLTLMPTYVPGYRIFVPNGYWTGTIIGYEDGQVHVLVDVTRDTCWLRTDQVEVL